MAEPKSEPKEPRPSTGFIPIGVLVVLPALVATLALDVLSVWGLLEWLACVLLGVGLISAPYRRQRAWGPSRTGVAMILLLLVSRGIAGGVSPHARLLVLPAGHEARYVDRLFEERDAAILGARLFSWTGALDAPEAPTLAPLLVGTFDDMESELGHRMGSVVVSTLSGDDTGDAFSAFVVEPDGPPQGSLVFLHGYGGNFIWQCWQVAVAARAAGMTTVCPSTRFDGHWSSGHGERIARVALEWARRSEVMVLAGLSNGGVGASRLAADLGHDLDGLVLLSGADPDAGDPGVPTLVLTGDHDGMMPPEISTQYRDRHAERVRFVSLPGTHFVILEQRDAVRAELTRFLLDRVHADARPARDASR